MRTLLKRPIVLLGIIAIIFVVVFIRFHSSPSLGENNKPIEIKWLLSHQPTSVFARASAVFADELSKESGGQMKLSVVYPADIGWEGTGDIPNDKVLDYLRSGEVQLATTYTVGLGKEAVAFWGLSLPYLFDSYSQAGTVLDGSAGQEILDSASAYTDTHALAFTMSGGFRIIVSKNTAIKSAVDLKGLHIATSGGPVAEATLEALGAVPVPTDLESGDPEIDVGTIDGLETTYSRLSEVVGKNTQYTKYINETNHSLFLTVILASNTFYNSLSPQNQAALKKAALAAARTEREDSIALGGKTKSGLISGGSIVTIPNSDARSAMQAQTESVYKKFESTFGSSLIASLRSAR